ncbi:MAG: FAD-binding oxidoreductase [Thermoflexales bacterium]|nr:FAD-binding oxidoreductase [Thermoflexales bacterium]
MDAPEHPVDTCDVVVVGAGIVGAAVAARLARQGLQVAVLEAQQVAGGATGRSAGLLLTGLPGHYHWAVQSLGRETARALWELSVEGRERLMETATRLGVPVERTGSLALAVTEEEAEALRASAELLREDGFEAWFGRTDPLQRGFLAALRSPGDGVVDAADLTRALLASAPVAVHTHTEVQALEAEGAGIRVWAYRRAVRCGAVVLAAGGYAPTLEPALSRWVSPGHALRITARLDKGQNQPPLTTPCYTDYGYEYARPLPDGHLLLGAWRYLRRPSPSESSPDPDTALRGGLSRFVRRYFPTVEGNILQRQSGMVGCTPDGVPVVGVLSHLPGVYFALGLGGWGLCWAFVVAERVVEMMLEGTPPGLLDAERGQKR